MSVEDRHFVLDKAKEYTSQDRNVDYDSPENNFRRIAELWSTYLEDRTIQPHDVAVMCALIKVSRIMSSPDKADHWIDLAGYSACGWDARVASQKKNK